MSNDSPPRACLADFGFMTMVLDPNKPMSCSAQLEGGTITFMSPELLVPSVFGVKNPFPTPEADIYAFGLVILQVLTGEIPFRGVRTTELGFSVVQGLRPDKPANAPTIGFSEPLWIFVQGCWARNMNMRPKVAEVVTHLARAAASWDGLMPPCTEVENVASVSRPPVSNSMEHIRIFDTPSAARESLMTTSGLFGYPRAPSTAYTEPPREELLGTSVKLPTEPPLDRWDSVLGRPQELPDDLREFHHVALDFRPPPSTVPPPKLRSFQSFKAKLRGFFGRLRAPHDN